tara:strand:- start:247 stop:372 length:126 start_codon:yes stop_codon:yes gene_type:complete
MRNFVKIPKKNNKNKPSPKRDDWKRKRNQARKDKLFRRKIA